MTYKTDKTGETLLTNDGTSKKKIILIIDTIMNLKLMTFPNEIEFKKGCIAFKEHVKQESSYNVTTFILNHFWGKTPEMADGLAVLLSTWNQAFYRFGSFDYVLLEKCINLNLQKLKYFREKDILTLSDNDKTDIISLFNQFLDALKIIDKKNKPKKSPVSVAKALHVLAPNFFPPWDSSIANKYGCNYRVNPSEQYFLFCEKIMSFASLVVNYKVKKDKTLIKYIDEYNFAKYSLK